MKHLQALFNSNKKVKSIFFTAGFPQRNNLKETLELLQNNSIDMVEIGIPFSDPLADGEQIQKSSQIALQNGFTLDSFFDELQQVKEKVNIPIVVMGYFNPVFKYGVEKFLIQCQRCNIQALILPDLPMEVYKDEYDELFKQYALSFVPMVAPGTSDERIQFIDQAVASSFIYAVSSHSTTGNKLNNRDQNHAYLDKLSKMQLKHPIVIGFGIKTKSDIESMHRYAKGIIIGSAFVKSQSEGKALDFLKSLS